MKKTIFTALLRSLVLMIMMIDFVFPHSTAQAWGLKDISSFFQSQRVSSSHEADIVFSDTAQDTTDNQLRVAVVKAKTEEPKKVVTVVATAYSSTPDQTDATPFITANGLFVYDGLIAANFLPLGTKVKLPELFGEKLFTVNDRMHSRYNRHHRIDIWMPTREDAKEFGVHQTSIEIY